MTGSPLCLQCGGTGVVMFPGVAGSVHPKAMSCVCVQSPTVLTTTARTKDGPALHDGAIYDPVRCPRGLSGCAPLARYASPDFVSFMCCGETSDAPVPTDRLRLCIKSTHDTGVDLLVNLDERDAVHTSAVLLGGLSALGSVKISAVATEEPV